MNLADLKAPFAPSEVSWRIGQAGKNRNGIWAKVLAYIDNRCIQDRLDQVVGPEHWANEFKAGPGGGVVCGISIEVSDNKWVTKWDGAENSDIEAIKGGLSDSMKRAAVQWGIGRYLYDLGESWAEISEDKKPDYHYANTKIKHDGKEEYVQFYWLPPRLPAFAIPKADSTPPQTEKAQKVAKQHGMTTADKLEPSENYKRAMDKITTAVKELNVDAVAGVMNLAEQNRTKLSKAEFDGITNECTLALKKISAAEKRRNKRRHSLDATDPRR